MQVRYTKDYVMRNQIEHRQSGGDFYPKGNWEQHFRTTPFESKGATFSKASQSKDNLQAQVM